MTSEEVIAKYEKMEGMFGSLPSHIHEPIQFAYLVKLFEYRVSQQNTQEIQ
jgi:hypothetical protein